MKLKNFSFLLMIFFITALSSFTYSQEKEAFLGTHHVKGPNHERMIEAVKNCDKNPICSPQGPLAFLLGIVIEFKEEGYTFFHDANLSKKELGLLEEDAYEPKRRYLIKGRWGLGNDTLTLTRKDDTNQYAKSLFQVLSVGENKIKIKSLDEKEEINRLERLQELKSPLQNLSLL